MKIIASTFLAVVLLTTGASAAGPNHYQVTGTVTAVTVTVLTVQKGKEMFECARTAETKVTGGEAKVGDKVTVHYTITAVSVENKGVAPAKKPAAAAAAAPVKP